jgi:hypothetical protein
MPARTASGRASQRSQTRARSGHFEAKSAKQAAKTAGPLAGAAAEGNAGIGLTSAAAGAGGRFSRPVQSAALPPLRTPVAFSPETAATAGPTDSTLLGVDNLPAPLKVSLLPSLLVRMTAIAFRKESTTPAAAPHENHTAAASSCRTAQVSSSCVSLLLAGRTQGVSVERLASLATPARPRDARCIDGRPRLRERAPPSGQPGWRTRRQAGRPP